jgi:ABC-type antimicrobial peptide transport system permease subunit
MTSETATASLVLLSAVTFVLLIACANVANLLLVRGADRRRELAIRVAPGASSSRIAQLVLTESLGLSAMGGLIGLLLAGWGSRALTAALGGDAPYWIQFGIDARVLGFGILLTLATGTICGLVPAVQATRPGPQHALKASGSTITAAGGRRVQTVLAAGQLTLR